MKSFNDIRTEAYEYGISVEWRGDKVSFRAAGKIVAWMYRISGGWQGFTITGTTGTKKGQKGVVANWCLDWAVNGF